MKNFNSNYACRFCKIEKAQRKYCCKADLSKLRNRENYEADIKLNDKSKTGLTEECIFNDLPTFHATENLFADLIHDRPEGFIELDMFKIINRYLTKRDFFTLEELNNIMMSFDYGTYYRNVPPLISEIIMKNETIVMTTSI